MTPAPPLVPAPLEAHAPGGDAFVLDADSVVVAPEGAVPQAHAVARTLGLLCGVDLPVRTSDDGGPGAVVLELVDDPSLLGLTSEHGTAEDVTAARAAGAYRLVVHPDRVVVSALTPAGLVHGCATLAQAARRGGDGTVQIPALTVRDVPRFGWRGLSLDVARHFLDVPTVLAVVDLLASLKLNVLHLHLTDDQGWRLEIPSRPLLTEVSGRTAVDGDPGGWYSVADFQRIVTYAAARGITVVPEIDLPGHVNAALHAYGELTPSGEAPPAYTGIEVGFSRLHAEVAATGPFLDSVLRDVAAQTPGPYVHLGGDEVLEMGASEYRHLLQVAARRVRAAGKTVVGWQEVARADLGPDTVIQYWTHEQSADEVAAAVAQGASLLLSPGRRVYLDMKYDATTALGLSWAGHIELRDAYEWDPLAEVPGVPEVSIVGIEAAIWSETVHDLDELTFLLLPRLAAVAELAWSAPERLGWAGFSDRVRGLTTGWDAAGLTWYRSPQVDWDAG